MFNVTTKNDGSGGEETLNTGNGQGIARPGVALSCATLGENLGDGQRDASRPRTQVPVKDFLSAEPCIIRKNTYPAGKVPGGFFKSRASARPEKRR